MSDRVTLSWDKLEGQSFKCSLDHFDRALNHVEQCLSDRFGVPVFHLNQMGLSISEAVGIMSIAQGIANNTTMEYMAATIAVAGDRIVEGCEILAEVEKN